MKRFRLIVLALCVIGVFTSAGMSVHAQEREPGDARSESSEADSGGGNNEEGTESVTYGRDELRIVFHHLSYVDSENCLSMLESLGYRVGEPDFPIEAGDLPVIFSLPDSQHTSVVDRNDLDQPTDSAMQQRIGIVYHSDYPDQYRNLQEFLEEYIDVPASQVQIEAMVIELREEGTRELGLEYEWEKGGEGGDVRDELDIDDGQKRGRGAFFNREDEGMFGLSIMRFSDHGTPEIFEANLRALLEEKKAEVLSAPSVLTLDNRHARIDIAEDVPIIERSEFRDSDSFDLNVRFEEVGIIMSIKPRVSETGKWVTMQVQTEVSDAPEDKWITRGGDKVAPRIERRKVESIARIRNNHPFIIGGLIRDDSSTTTRKVPLLGSIPVLGALFRSEENTKEKREVIIVLTPRVIQHEASDRPIMPKDSERFDFFDTELFREAYTLKSDDIYDLGFILERPDIQRTLQRAQRYIDQYPRAARKPPFSMVADDSIPGEEAIVNRMLYDIVRKMGIFEEINLDDLIYFVPEEFDPSGFKVAWLANELEKVSGELSVEEYLEKDFPKKVLYVIFDMDEEQRLAPNIRYPIANIMVEEHEDQESAEERLYELGKVEGINRDKIGFMIAGKRDVERLKISVVVREILDINDPEALHRLENFTVSRRIAIPDLEEAERTFLIDRNVAKPFYMSNFYYAEFQEIFQTTIQDIRKELEDGEGRERLNRGLRRLDAAIQGVGEELRERTEEGEREKNGERKMKNDE